MSGDEDTIFGRWSRRKRAVAEEEAAVRESAPEPEALGVLPSKSDHAPPEESEDELLARLGLPDPENLEQGDDFSAFMQAGVPEFLRKRALRRLWTSNPVLANLDGLNDYDDDFNAPEMIPKVVETAYKVGRGILRDLSETDPEDVSAPQDGDSGSIQASSESLPESPAVDSGSNADDWREAETHNLPEGGQDIGNAASQKENPLRPKRMTFRSNS